MNNEYDEDQMTDDEYNDDYEDEYSDENEDFEDDDFEEEDSSGSSGGKHGGNGKIFVIVLFLMAAIGGSYFGLRFLDADIVKNFSISSILKGSEQSSSALTQSSQSSEDISSPDSSAQSSTSQETSSQETSSQESIENTSDNSADETSSDTEKSEESEVKITFENDSRSKFLYLDGGYLYLTKDGAKYYVSLDNQEWNDTYTMSSVTGVSNGKYAIINDVQGRNIRLYSTSGLQFSAQTDGNIVSCTLNSQGTSAVIQKYDNDYKISVLRNDGQLLMERFEQDSGVYPLSAALSEDSKILAVTYMDTSDIEIKAKILLFYVNKEDSKNTATGEFFAGIEKEDMIAPYIFYLDGNFVIVHDKGLFAVNQSGNEVWNTEISNRIDAVACTEGGNIAIALGDELAGSNGFENGTVCILNKNGKEKAEYFMGDDISYLKAVGKNIVVGSGNDFACINESARENWSFTATQVIKDIFPYSGSKALVITGTEAKVINVK